MFDGSLPQIDDLASLSDAELVDAAGGWARAENAAAARKLAVMAEIFIRRTNLPADDRDSWWVDPHAAVAAELAAAVNISHGLALHQTHRGLMLRDRMPKVAALLADGVISDMLVRTIVARTHLIDDDAAIAAVDAALAARITRWGAWSAKRTETAIDELVDRFDPGALRRSRESTSSPTVQFGAPTDAPGTTSLWARLYAPDAAAIEARVEETAQSVCPEDPRPIEERRAAALTALAAGTDLACACGQDDCPGPRQDRVAKNLVVYVVADQTTVDAARADTPPTEPNDPADPPEDPPDLAKPAEPPAESATADPPGNKARCSASPAYVFGGGILPTALLSAILERGTIRTVHHPGDAPPEPRYTPSRQLCDFVRCRDLTCRFPGCDKPAQFCDLDHTVAYPVGPTHASNLKCLCRFHHLLKTFWNGANGWRDRQLPDGTIIWTSPTGHTYTTYPGAMHLFPTLCAPTATLWSAEPPTVESAGDRGAMMPKRRHTRADDTAKAKAAERRLNDAHVAERNKPPPF